MSVLSAQSIRKKGIFTPFHERTIFNGMSFGLSSCGYDVRIRESMIISPGKSALGSTLEHFNIPVDIIAMIKDKSTWARRGLAVQNTVAEPGWRGFLTLELSNHGNDQIEILSGDPIAQVILQFLDEPTEQPYRGKYQDQRAGPQIAKVEAY